MDQMNEICWKKICQDYRSFDRSINRSNRFLDWLIDRSFDWSNDWMDKWLIFFLQNIHPLHLLKLIYSLYLLWTQKTTNKIDKNCIETNIELILHIWNGKWMITIWFNSCIIRWWVYSAIMIHRQNKNFHFSSINNNHNESFYSGVCFVRAYVCFIYSIQMSWILTTCNFVHHHEDDHLLFFKIVECHLNFFPVLFFWN